MTHLLVRYTWRQLGLDGTTQLLSNPESKPVKRALHAALLSSETAWPAFGRADLFIYLFFPLSTFEANMSEWVRLWFGCFYLSEWERGVQGTVLKGGRERWRCRPEERSVQKKKGLETKGRFWAQVRQEASEPHERREIKTAALSLSPWKRPTTFKSDIFF